jgi:two-component system C4-dicarboxylate transport sensor histidine kinase DctB
MPSLLLRWRFFVILALSMLVLLWPLHGLIQSYYLGGLQRKNSQTLDLFAANLSGTLKRYEILPQILGRLPEVQNALLQPQQTEALAAANHLLARMQQQTRADVVYLLDTRGTTIAASNWQHERSFIGHNFSFRPYFFEAMEQRTGTFFGLGNISLKRGYYFGNAVYVDEAVVGVLVVKVDLDFTESLWGNTPERLMVTDSHGVVILSSERDWLFRASRELMPAELAQIAGRQPYASQVPEPLGLADSQWLRFDKQLEDISWTVNVLVPRKELVVQVQTAMAVITASMLALLLVLGLLMQRRRHYLERIEMDARARAELEGRVQQRTLDLQTLNQRLREEVLERESTRQALVRTQDELVQAGKLSALGVMSASISHELSQPLAAIRSYGDNAKVFLEQRRLPEVAGNLDLITALTGRMASIIEHLRAFARRDPQASEHVALQPAIEDALALLAGRIHELGVHVVRDIPDATLWVEAGETRLRQVLGNLLANALDALAEQGEPRTLELSTQQTDDWTALRIVDNGPGFGPEALLQAREPFFTTKTSARGLGLGLAICDAVIKSLGGRLEFANRPEGGACVELYLKSIMSEVNLEAREDFA